MELYDMTYVNAVNYCIPKIFEDEADYPVAWNEMLAAIKDYVREYCELNEEPVPITTVDIVGKCVDIIEASSTDDTDDDTGDETPTEDPGDETPTEDPGDETPTEDPEESDKPTEDPGETGGTDDGTDESEPLADDPEESGSDTGTDDEGTNDFEPVD